MADDAVGGAAAKATSQRLHNQLNPAFLQMTPGSVVDEIDEDVDDDDAIDDSGLNFDGPGGGSHQRHHRVDDDDSAGWNDGPAGPTLVSPLTPARFNPGNCGPVIAVFPDFLGRPLHAHHPQTSSW